MRFKVALAFLISIILIGGASWSRFGTPKYARPNITTVEQGGEKGIYDAEILQNFLTPKTETANTITPTTSLSDTDLIGRGLIMSYIDLATSGQATEDRITALADQYVEGIPTLNKAEILQYTDIKSVPDTQSNFQQYANNLTDIHQSYATSVKQAGVGPNGLNTLNPELYSFASTFSNAYKNAALKLKDVPVPSSLAQNHLQLLNSYLSSATAMEAVSKTEQDSASAFAGLIVLNENLNKEDVLLIEISKILTSHGI